MPNVVRDLRPDELEENGGRHRDAEPEDRLVRVLDARAVVERVGDDCTLPREHPVHDEARSVSDEHATLPERPGHGPGGCERHVVGLRCPHELDQREHGHGVEEVHADDTLRMLEIGGHRRDRE